ncbi:hypothetical protein FDECE_3454 [Fusarium decemcellulare]|nr:hypothetical protein FDECE_3454 [Fusarium decemcellulare]
MDSMALLSKDCLDVGCGSILDFLPSSSSTTKRFNQDSHSDSNDTSSEVTMRSVRPTINAPSQPSIMVQVAKVMKNRRPGSPANFPINDLVESIMVWKLTHFQTLGSEFLVTHLGLDKSPLCITAGEHAIAAADFYTLILSKFYTGERILALNTDIIVEDTLIQMPAMAQQRRLIAYYVGILLQEPNLRSKLAQTWKQYDIDELVAIMGESFKLAEFTGKHCPVPIYVVPGTSDLEVDSDFRAGIFNLQNYSLGAKFTDRYPDLGPHIT